jgi:type II secretory pathway component PulF
MAIIVTPRSLGHRAELYHQLGALTSAGVGLPRALETVGRSPPSRSFRPVLADLAHGLESGLTFGESLRQSQQIIPEFDVALIDACEVSGRLDWGLNMLSEHYRERASTLQGMISDFLYPAFVFHAAVFILPFSQAFLTGDWAGYLLRAFGLLGLVYGLVFAVLYACQGRRGAHWRAYLESMLRLIPIIGTTRQAWALSRLCAALEALISAGISIIEAWTLAAGASGSPALRRTVAAWQDDLASGKTPGELVADSSEFPEMFASQYQTGEMSGKLDHTLQRLHAYYLDEANRRARLLAQWVPRLVYLGLMLVIAYRIVAFYANYFGQLAPLL